MTRVPALPSARWLSLLALAGLTFGLCLTPASSRGQDPAAQAAAAAAAPASSDPASLVGKAAPTFSIPLRTGGNFDLKALQGKVVVLNLWATWCPPCVEELPSLERLRRQLKGQAVEIVAVSVDDDWPVVDKLFKDKPVGFTVLLDSKRTVPNLYGVSKFPETFILDKQGNVVRKLIGAQIWDRGDFVESLKVLARQ